MDVLVACPISRRKGYSLHEWEQATKGHDRLMVTEEPDYLPEIYKAGITALPYVSPPLPENWQDEFRHEMCTPRFNAAWKTIIDHAGYHDFILSLESDVIPPEGVDIVELMVKAWDGSVDFLVHLYPYRASYNRPGKKCFEMGCTMASAQTWKRAMSELPENVPLYWAVYQEKYTNKRIDEVPLEHLDG